jgi:ribosome-binding protein aMBF1 (putative translation factor)
MSSTETVPDPLVLAAIERAERHDPQGRPAVPVWRVYDHLSVAKRSGQARHVRACLDALETAGSIVRSRRHGVQAWALTSTGRRRLTRARRAGDMPALPESPQHRAWRNAQTLAAQEVDRFLQSVRDGIGETMSLLDADPAVGSDAWFELGERLQRDCRRVGSATYCLHEWSEPTEAHPDVDDHVNHADELLSPSEQVKRRARRVGRRNTSLWDTPAEQADKDRELIALGQAVRELRSERNMSKRELATTAGLTRSLLDAIEAGQHDPTYERLLLLAVALGVKPSAIANRSEASVKDGDT